MSRQLRRSSRLFSLFVLLVGCGEQAGSPEPDAGTAARVEDASEDESASQCRAPAGVSNAPNSIAQVVELLNALPKPVTLPCFLESLARPLALHAVDSEFSAQPAAGARSPRIFLFIDPLILSVVPAGSGAQLLEFGEQRSLGRTLKAELEFPIHERLDAAAPYRRVEFTASLSACGVCHQGEERADDVASPLAFVSPALRPLPNQRVPLTTLMAELDRCDETQEAERCAMLVALLRHGPAPHERDFPSAFSTFF